MPTQSFEVFEYSYNRLDALFMQSFEEPNDYRDEMKELLKELIVIQVVASAEAYKMDLTREILNNHLKLLASPKSTKEQIMKMFSDPTNKIDWLTLYEDILDVGVNVKGDIPYNDWIRWLQNGILPTLTISKSDLLSLIEITSTRNLLIHHRGIVQTKYINRTNDYFDANTSFTRPIVGQKREIDIDYCANAMKCFQRIISLIDDATIGIL